MSNFRNFLIVSIIPHKLTDIEAFEDIKELKQLVDAYEGKVIDFVIQRREVHDKGKYIGKGKIEEITKLLKLKPIDVVVFNAIVNPGHIFDMKRIWQKGKSGLEVWDRVDLILHIFSRHARTAEAKIQIELAAMRHMGPRIYGMGHELSRQGGSIGTRGIGETNTELMKRHWRQQMKSAKEKLNKLSGDHFRLIERRRKNGFKTISLIGYTNAGKTSLFNLLTGKKKLIKDALFVTLDSNVGKTYLPSLKQEVLVSDTIGFINNLPAKLIDAFKSTLMESIQSDVLIFVIDISDEENEKKILAVESILQELRISDKKRIYVFNKIDKVNEINKKKIFSKYCQFQPQFISVKNKEGIYSLLEKIGEKLILPTSYIHP